MSEKKDDGGPAFPKIWESVNFGDGQIPSQGGITTRDYFAAKAMEGFIGGKMLSLLEFIFGTSSRWSPEFVAERAYEYADAMLAERRKP